jgi:exosortase B
LAAASGTGVLDLTAKQTSVGAVLGARSGSSLFAWTAEKVLAALVVASAILIYVPTYVKLYQGPWQTEQEGHGPLIMLASAWLAWRKRNTVACAGVRPAYGTGWTTLLVGLALMAVGRSQDLLIVESGSQILVLAAAILLTRGWGAARALAFPLAFLVFSVPPPGWALDALTVPLKGGVSDAVAALLYALGYPVAQNGVIIMVGAYELMVKDACSGMNSIFALSAIGVFYIYEFVANAPLRTALLIVSIVPITVLANFLRVVALVLATYYLGADAVEGLFHDFTGILLFVAAIILFFVLDGVIVALGALVKWRGMYRGSSKQETAADAGGSGR